MNLEEIQSLIKFVSRSGAEEVELETKDVKITIKAPSKKRGKAAAEQPSQVVHQVPVMPQMPAQQPMPQQAPAPAPAAPAEKPTGGSGDSDDSKYITVKSPMIGTFYRRPAPDKDVFVEVGDVIKEGDVTCIIEAMKLFNEIESEVSGKIVKILAEDSSPVEYDQPLFLVDPS